MSLLHPPSFLVNNKPPAGGPSAASAFVPQSSIRSNVAFVGLVVAAVVLYKGARLWAWLGDKVKEKRSLVVAQELVSQELSGPGPSSSRKGAAPVAGGSHPSGSNPAGERQVAADGAQPASGQPAGSRDAAGATGTPARRRRRSKASAGEGPSISHAARGAGGGALSPLSCPTPLPAPPTGPASQTVRQTASAVAGPSSAGAPTARRPSVTGDRHPPEMGDSFTVVSPHAAKRPAVLASARGKGKAVLDADDALPSVASGPPVSPSVTTKKAKKAAAAAARAKGASEGDASPDPRSRTLAPSPSPSARHELSPPSSVSSVAMSAASSQAGGNSSDTTQATTLASSTLSLGLDFSPLSALRMADDSDEGPAPLTARQKADDKALRHELATTLDRLHAAQGSLDATQAELRAERERAQAAETTLRTAEADAAASVEARDAARLLGDERAGQCEAAQREVESLRAELRTRKDEAKRSADESKRRERERDKLKREVDRWKEDGRRWEHMEREYRRSDTELRFQLHHTNMACHQQLNQIRMLEQVVRQYNQAFAPAAAVATAALSGQSGPMSPMVYSPPPAMHPQMVHHSLSPTPFPSRPGNRRTPPKALGDVAQSPVVVLPSPQVEVPYPALPDPGSTSEEDVSDDVALSILKNPGGLGVGSQSQRSRNGSFDSTCGSASGSSSIGARLDEERSDGGPAAGDAHDKGTPELVFASVPSYDEHSRPRSSAAGSTSGESQRERDLSMAELSPPNGADRGRPAPKQPQPSDGESPSTPMGTSAQPTSDDHRPETLTPRASGLPAAASPPS